MTEFPLVSVITPAQPSRLGVLTNRCIYSVKAQTYPYIEHVIVAEQVAAYKRVPVEVNGWKTWRAEPDHSMRDAAIGLGCRYIESMLPQRNPHWGAHQRLVGLAQSAGSIICYLDDDDELKPDHVATMVELLEPKRIKWAYAAVDWHRPDGVRYTWSNPPEPGNVSSILAHKRTLKAPWQDGPREDWELVSGWLEKGIPYATDSRVTADAYSHD